MQLSTTCATCFLYIIGSFVHWILWLIISIFYYEIGSRCLTNALFWFMEQTESLAQNLRHIFHLTMSLYIWDYFIRLRACLMCSIRNNLYLIEILCKLGLPLQIRAFMKLMFWYLIKLCHKFCHLNLIYFLSYHHLLNFRY
jgi:hypothetical protein